MGLSINLPPELWDYIFKFLSVKELEFFKLTAEDARSCNNYTLRRAHLNGHLEVCKWLKDTFGIE